MRQPVGLRKSLDMGLDETARSAGNGWGVGAGVSCSDVPGAAGRWALRWLLGRAQHGVHRV